MANSYLSGAWHGVFKFADGALAVDSSTIGNTLTNNGVTYNDGGQFTRSESDYMTRLHGDLGAGFPGTSGYTDLGLWVEFTLDSNPTTGQYYYIAGKFDGVLSKKSWTLRYTYTGSNYVFQFVLGHTGGASAEGESVYSSATPLETGVRYCFGLSFNDSTKAIYAVLFKKSDGSFVADHDTTTTNNMSAADGDFTVGCSKDNGSPVHYFDGQFHLLAISNTPKTEADFNALAAGFYNSDTPEAVYKCHVDWDNDGDYDDANEDISDDILFSQGLGISLFYGRSSDIDHDEPGRARVALDNSTGKYSRENDASPIYGDIETNRPVQISMQFGQKVNVFTGYLDDIDTPTPDTTNVAVAYMNVKGIFSQFDEADTDIALQSAEKTSDAITEILDADGWAAGARDIDTGLSTMLRWWSKSDRSRLALMQDLQDMEQGRVRENRDGDVVFEARDRIHNAPYDSAMATFGTGGLNLWEPRRLYNKAQIYNEFSARVYPYYLTSEQDLVTVCDVDNDLGGEPPVVPFGESITIYAEIPSGSRFKAAVSWGTPTKEANSAADGSGSDITGSVSIVLTGYANRAKLVITNAHGSLDAHMIKLIVPGVPIVFGDITQVRSSDATSQTKYGKRSYPYPGVYYAGSVESQEHADHIITKFKDPRPPFEFEVRANYDQLHMFQAMTRELGDRIHVTEDDLYLDEDFVIDSIRHDIRSPYEHKVLISCTPAPTDQLAATSTTYTLNTVPDDEYIITGGAAGDINAGNGLDDIDDGVTYARGRGAGLDGGYPKLSTAVGDLDDVSDGATYGRARGAGLSGGYARLDTAVGDLDDVGDGTTYGKVLNANLSSGYVRRARSAASGARWELDETNGMVFTDATAVVQAEFKANGNIYLKDIYSVSNNHKIVMRTDNHYEFGNTSNSEAVEFTFNSGSVTIAANGVIGPGADLILSSYASGNDVIIAAGAGATTLATFSGSGLDLESGDVYSIGGTQVLGARQSHIADPAANVTALAAWAAQINTLNETHGFVATS